MSYNVNANANIYSAKAENIMTEAYVVVELGTGSGQVDLPSATTDFPFGVTLNSAPAVGDAVNVQLDGIVQIVTAGAVTKGAQVSIASTTGRIDDATTSAGTLYVGVAMEASGGAGEIIPVRLAIHEQS